MRLVLVGAPIGSDEWLPEKCETDARSRALYISKRDIQHGERFDVSGGLERTGMTASNPILVMMSDLLRRLLVVACDKYRDGFALNRGILRRIDLYSHLSCARWVGGGVRTGTADAEFLDMVQPG